ncbi:MAG: serine hydrolase domain-containing protein [Phycisphaerales bacterium]
MPANPRRMLLAMLLVILPSSLATATATVRGKSATPPVVRVVAPEPVADADADAAIETDVRIATLFSDVHRRDAFHGVVLVAAGGTIIHESAWGIADDGRDEPVTPTTRFEFASVSKPITAIATLSLVADGVIGLDDRVSTHLPTFPWSGVTVRHLLSHRSGLPARQIERAVVERAVATSRRIDNDLVMEVLASFRSAAASTTGDRRDAREASGDGLEHEPGAQAIYENVNFVVLARLVAVVSGQPFAEAVKARVFTPAGMTHAVVSDPATWMQPKAGWATPYVRDASTGSWQIAHTAPAWEFTVRAGGTRGDGGVVGTARDLLALDRALVSGRLIPPALAAASERPARGVDGRELWESGWVRAGFGLGWRIRDDRSTVFHTGDWGGFQAGIFRFRAIDRTVIFLSHRRIDDWSWLPELEAIVREAAGEATGAAAATAEPAEPAEPAEASPPGD